MKVVLIGFMGAGKTTVAQLLAGELKLQLVELDDVILEMSSRSTITEIFEEEGEESFRDLESAAVNSVNALDNVVISAGGGVVTREGNMLRLREKRGIIVFLHASFEVITERLAGNTERPLFRNLRKAEALYLERLQLYKKYSDLKVLTDSKGCLEVSNEICGWLKRCYREK
jgi:shikimate kinase